MHVSLPSQWRKYPERYNLLGNYCLGCKTAFFPPRAICPYCRRKGKLIAKEIPREGRIISYTKVHSPPTGFKHEAPYYLALVDVKGDAKILAQIVDSREEDIVVGAKVKKVFRRIGEDNKEGIISYGYKFKVEK